ncbi:unnamed protein product, partial [Larinioides sclopetarius]
VVVRPEPGDGDRRENLPERRFVRRGQPSSGELRAFRVVLSPKSIVRSCGVRAVLSLDNLGYLWFIPNPRVNLGVHPSEHCSSRFNTS